MTNNTDNPDREILSLLPGYDPFRDADGFTYDKTKADRAVNFFRMCITHMEGPLAGKPYILRPHEECLTRNIFGWVDKDGKRRYRQCLYFVPRKNSKSTWAAGVALYCLAFDGEMGAQVYSAAGERDQAGILFRMMSGMIANDEGSDDPFMSNILQVKKGTKVIDHAKSNSFYKALSAEAGTKHGMGASCVIFDELHTQPNRDLYDVLKTSQGSRPQPLFISITTSDYDRPSICNEVHKYATDVRGGSISDPHFLPAIYEASIDDDWKDPEVWATCNPNLGHSVSMEFLEQECLRAQSIPSYQNTFKRLHLNIKTEQSEIWLDMADWDACAGEPVAQGPCYMGLDLSSRVDITALVLFFPETMSVLCNFWLPESALHGVDVKNKDIYEDARVRGLIDFTPGNTIDQGYIRMRVNELARAHDVKLIAFDDWNATQLSIQLHTDDGLPLVVHRQNLKAMNEPCKNIEAMVKDQSINHGGNAILRWMAANVAIYTDSSGNIKIDKSKSASKVDGMVALAMAVGAWLADDLEQASVYESRGVLQV